jgi:hypothetical protein
VSSGGWRSLFWAVGECFWGFEGVMLGWGIIFECDLRPLGKGIVRIWGQLLI